MSFINRAINVVTQPNNEMPRAAAEPATQGGLIGGYAAIVGALPAIGYLLGVLIAAGRFLSYVIGSVLVTTLLMYALRDVGLTIAIGLIAGALAPNFGGQSNKINALKLAVYAATPIWIMGLLAGLLSFTGSAAIFYLFALIGFGYAGYLIYLGAGPMLGVQDAQKPVFAGILTVIWLVLYIVVHIVVQQIGFSMLTGGTYYGM